MKNLISITLLLLSATVASLASDHKEAPFVSERPPVDIADLYTFLSPEDGSKLVLAMTVNPFSVTSEAFAFNYSPGILYRFHIDNDGDAVADHLITFQFRADQSYTVSLPNGTNVEGFATAPSEEPEPNEARIVDNGDGVRIFAGPRDDPFFFDVVGFVRFLSGTGAFTGSDGFAGFNVSALVIELPLDMISDGSDVLNTWASTGTPFSVKNHLSLNNIPSSQIDRVGNPAVATALIPTGLKDAYNRTRPVNDAKNFAGDIVASLNAFGTSEDNIGILASVAVPDMLTINTAADSGFPNGRTLSDDVIDIILGLVLNNPDIGDAVDANDTEFSDTFPFLADPWQPE